MEVKNLIKDVILRGGQDMIDFNKIADVIINEGKDHNNINYILTNNLMGKLNDSDTNNKNFIELRNIVNKKLKGGNLDDKYIINQTQDNLIRNLGTLLLKYSKRKPKN